MKVAFGMIVCNGADFLEPCIRQIYDIANQIVIAEGATKNWMRALGWDTPESKDDTLDILKKLQQEDKDHKIQIISGTWQDKIHQSNGYMNFVSDDTDYIWQLDCDEFYMRDDLKKTFRWLAEKSPTYVVVKYHHFWKNFSTVAVGQKLGWGWETPAPRIQKFYKNCHYIEHRPPMIVDPYTGIKNIDVLPANLTAETGTWCYHYSYVTDKQVLEKMTYYIAEFPEASRLKTWIEKVWKQWDVDKDFVEHTYGTHPSAWQGSYTEPFNGIHPEEIERLIHADLLDNSQQQL